MDVDSIEIDPDLEEIQDRPQGPAERLSQIANVIKAGKEPESVTVRTLLGWFGAQRRGPAVVNLIDFLLARSGISTEPDYKSIWLDNGIKFVRAIVRTDHTSQATSDDASAIDGFPDPTYRLRRLKAAGIQPFSVRPQQTVKEALMIMMGNNFSQLPVMSGERSLDGVISFSSLAKRLALGVRCEFVKDCYEPAHVVNADVSLFDAIDDIVKHQYVLVQGADKRITGIVTTSDISVEFRQLGEPFLLLGEIEQHIRALIVRGNFTLEEIQECCDPRDTKRQVKSVSDLSFGEYVRIMENDARWVRLNIQLDRVEFKNRLQDVNRIRNDVMHFDPDPLSVQ